MPDRQEDESRDDFLSRCMADDKMLEEFPDNSQRYAVCNQYADKTSEVSAKMEDYIFSTPEGAEKKSMEIGFNGDIHTSTMADGTVMYFPAKTEEEFIEWYRKNDSDAEQELSALQYGRPPKNDPRKTPAKPDERRRGSDKNKPDSASKPNNSIEISKETENRLREMMREHNAKVDSKGKGSKATMGRLKSVFRRGAGAFSRTHAPNMSRSGWGIARVKAFLYLLRNGRPSNPNYKQDNDLLPKGHPRAASDDEDYQDWDESIFEAAEYKGRKVKLNKPFRTPKGPKKFAVYTLNEKGNVVIVRFGDPNMEIKRDDPQRLKNFRSRHNCDSPGPKWKARYWSCRFWERSKSVTDLLSEDINKTDDASSEVMSCGCGCGSCGGISAEEVEVGYYTTPEEASQKAIDMGCEGYHSLEKDGQTLYMPCDTHEEYMSMLEEEMDASYHIEEDSCPMGEEMIDGRCQKVAVTLDVQISIDETVIEASTGRQIVRISGIAFHEGINKNGWEITRKGADLAVPQMVGADLTLNHPPSEHGRFKRNMNGGVEDAVVGIVTEATITEKMNGAWDVRFKADVYRSELFEALESGLWLRQGYGVSIGGSGIPDDMLEAEDGRMIMTFESDFTFDHLAIVHNPAYNRANIETVEKIEVSMAQTEVFNSHIDYDNNQPKVKSMTEQEIIEASEEEVVETPDYASEIEALKASLAEREAELNAIREAEQAQAEEARLALVEKATEMGIAGISDLPSETISSIIASFEAKMVVEEVVEMKPVKASETPVESPAVVSDNVVANYLNGRKLNTPEEIYEKAFNVWAKAWNKTNSEPNMRSLLYAEAKENNLI